jgi:hypothetical protein
MSDEPKEPEPKPEPNPTAKSGNAITAEQFNKLVDTIMKNRSGDPIVADLRGVIADRDKYRDELADVKARLPKEGSVILDADGAKAWAAYQGLGDPAALTKALDEGKTAATERDDLKFNAHMGEVSGLMKWKPGVLADRVRTSGVEVIVKDEPNPKDPKAPKLKVPHVKLEGDKTTPLADYAKEHWADYLPALSTEPAKPEIPRGSPTSNGQAPPRPAVVATGDRPTRPLVR